MSFLRRLGKSDAGAAIVESLVATTLLGLALVYLVGSYSTLAISSRTAEQIALGQATARAQAARIKAAPYREDGNYSAYYDPLPPGLSRSVSVTWWRLNSGNGQWQWSGSQAANGLQMVTLTITWGSKTISRIDFVKADR